MFGSNSVFHTKYADTRMRQFLSIACETIAVADNGNASPNFVTLVCQTCRVYLLKILSVVYFLVNNYLKKNSVIFKISKILFRNFQIESKIAKVNNILTLCINF